MDTTAITATGTPPPRPRRVASNNAELGKDQFLKLFVAQLQHQDPMNPMQDQDFMGQMASFSTLEQVTNMAKRQRGDRRQHQLSQSVGLIGRTVTWTDADDVEPHRRRREGLPQGRLPVLTVSGTEGVDPTAITRSREPRSDALMMRGMFSAISGLKNHQVMLDVTANDIANVNTIGYKSARTTFKDSLTQLQRGASGAGGANGGTNAAQVGLGVGLGSIDNLMTGGALQSTGAALDVAIQGEGFFRVAQVTVARRPPPSPAGTVPQYTRAGNFTHQRGRLPAHAGGLLRHGPRRGRRRRRRHADPRPAGRHEHRDRPGRLGELHPGRRRRARHRGLPVARHVPEPGGPRARLGQPLDGLGQLRRRSRSPPPATPARA